MFSKVKFNILAMFLALSGASFLFAAEETKIMTYYASPDGDYKALRNTEDASLASADGSRVAIGSTQANAKLDVQGDLRATGSTVIEASANVTRNVTASGVTTTQGGLVIEARSSSPSSLENGRLWLDKTVMPS